MCFKCFAAMKIFNKIQPAIIPIVVGLLSFVILAMSVRGLPGNPQIEELLLPRWQTAGPFESSNDRGRFALTYSFLEDHSFAFKTTVARFATPDLAATEDGDHVSLFAPGVSFLVMPGYIVGKHFGGAQVGTFAIVSMFALLNGLLLYALAKRLGAHPVAASLAALTFLFATPAFTYAVSLSQHHFSVFVLLLSLYLLVRFHTWWSLSLVWFLCALSVVIDNPNVFFMFPVGMYALTRVISVNRMKEFLNIEIRPLYVLTFVTMAIPMFFLGWFNLHSNGSPYQLSGTLDRVLSVGTESQHDPLNIEIVSAQLGVAEDIKEGDANKEKKAVGFFETRNMLNGFDVHFVSPDRGMTTYAPIVLIGILGLFFLLRTEKSIAVVLIACIGANILLYSMWGDPWGGWAFGSRYLIPTYALLCLGLSLVLTRFGRNPFFVLIFAFLFVYSVGVNTLGALGTSAIPPRSEVLALEQVTGKVQKYDYERSYDYLNTVGSKSFVYQTWFSDRMSALSYYKLVSTLIVVSGLVLLTSLIIGVNKKS